MNEYRGLTYRQRNIIEILQHKDFATIGELADLCQVSNPTIRRDLIYLESIKFIERFYGGAKINTSRNIEILNYHKYYSHWAEKMRIGAKAAELVEDGDFIALNTGTTMMAFAQNLSRKKIFQ